MGTRIRQPSQAVTADTREQVCAVGVTPAARVPSQHMRPECESPHTDTTKAFSNLLIKDIGVCVTKCRELVSAWKAERFDNWPALLRVFEGRRGSVRATFGSFIVTTGRDALEPRELTGVYLRFLFLEASFVESNSRRW
ncbi:hypothetical protein E2C01_069817 [Portunus trituberculatus]|uniref:Uncharacterized protein n=1 Tax=Portunus trituberculatus TaxID=210409 RepID=A0A5B7HSJ5_PORTR|nr:hypothetical protein [Portunus trituberculatus]